MPPLHGGAPVPARRAGALRFARRVACACAASLRGRPRRSPPRPRIALAPPLLRRLRPPSAASRRVARPRRRSRDRRVLHRGSRARRASDRRGASLCVRLLRRPELAHGGGRRVRDGSRRSERRGSLRGVPRGDARGRVRAPARHRRNLRRFVATRRRGLRGEGPRRKPAMNSLDQRSGVGAPVVSRFSVFAAAAALFVTLAGACDRAPGEDRAGAVAVSAADTTVFRVPVEGAPAIGDARAAVTLVAFSDYECPFCGRADALVAQLRKAYGPKLRFVMRQHPLPIHAHARAAALAALAADQQGKFWPMHEKLFASARSLDEESLVRLAGEAGLDVGRWQQARSGAEAALARDEALAEALGVTGTPTFFVDGRKIVGAQPIDVFQQTIDEEIAKVEALTARGVRPEDVYATLMKGAVDKAPAAAVAKPSAAGAPAGDVEHAAGKPGCAPGGDCGCNGGDVEEADPGPAVDVPVGAAPVRGDVRAP